MKKEKTARTDGNNHGYLYKSLLKGTHLSVFNGKNVLKLPKCPIRENSLKNYGISTINIMQPLKCRIFSDMGKVFMMYKWREKTVKQ